MKKILLVVICCMLLPVGAALAAAACSVTMSGSPATLPNRFIEFTLACTGDSGDGTVGNTTISRADLALASWPSFIYTIETIPGSGAAEPSAYTVTIYSTSGTSLVALSARSATAKEIARADEDLGTPPPITGALTVAVGDLGADNTATIKIQCLK